MDHVVGFNKMALILGLALGFTTCNLIDPVEGHYINVNKGLISELTFEGGYCTIEYLSFPVIGKYEISNGIVFINTGAALGTIKYQLEDQGILKGESLFIGGIFIRDDVISDYYEMIFENLLGYYKVSANKLNVREEPGSNSKIIGNLKKETIVEVTYVHNDFKWVKIKASNGTGYVFLDYLTPLENISK